MATAWRTAFATFSFVFMNCLLNIFNSWALRRSSWPDFEFPVFYTMSHMIVTALAALLLLAYVTPAATGMPTLSQFWHYKEALVPVAICTTLNLGLNNLSLTLVSLFVNQAIKAIAIARKYLLDEEQPIDILVEPTFEQDIRQGSNVVFKLEKSEPISREPTEADLSCKDKTDYTKLAGAISMRVRDGEEVALTVKGPVPVLVSVKAIAQAQAYLTDDGIGVKFAVQFRDLEDPELGNTPSTYLHMAILPDA